MSNRPFVTAIAATAVFVTGLALPAAAEDDVLTFAAEVNSCVAAVDSHLDLDDAARVRHFVTHSKQTGIGYVLTIETTVFGVAGERKYAAYCVAMGDNAPVKFRIDELET